jgi:large subunit ribosomal protein L15
MTKDVLSNLKPAQGSVRKVKRIGRGQGSGHGGTSTRGHKGAGSRSGTTYRPWFEGGQMPLARRVPKRGFTSPFRIEFQVVNVDALEVLASKGKIQNGIVTPESLVKIGVVRKKNVPVKILGTGELKARLDVTAHAFSKSAVSKIEKAGGKVQTITVATKE